MRVCEGDSFTGREGIKVSMFVVFACLNIVEFVCKGPGITVIYF